MANLAETQQQLFNFLQCKDSIIESLVTGNTEKEVKRRLHIYREAYQLRLTNHLAKQFPILKRLLQADAFETLSLAYLAFYPPTHFAIRGFGNQLADFLNTDPLYAKQASYSELAKLEWQLNEIIDETASQPLLNVAQLSALTPTDLANTCFQLQDYVRIVAFHYDTPLWRDALKKSLKAMPTLSTHPISYALWRKDFQAFYRPLTTRETHLLTALKHGASFAELCALAMEFNASDDTAAAQHVVQCLLTWINDGYFTATLTTRH